MSLPIDDAPVVPVPTRAERAALRIVQLGALAIVLVATTQRIFDLDRFFVPKELVLHVTAALSGLLLIRRIRIDSLLLGFLGVSLFSSLFATNGWLAGRAVAITASGIVLFGVGRALREAGLGREVLNAIGLAIVIAAITSLMQAYGIRLDIFAINRAPGGTLGNRNFVAHAMAFGLPAVMLAAMRGKRWGTLGLVLVTAALVLTRSRAAWLAFAAVIVVMLIAIVMLRLWKRLAMIAIAAAAGIVAALLIPNALHWRTDDNPYLESVRGVANYQEGSGRGRLIQYERSLLMSPIVGVGPGNWAVEYPRHVPHNDPSLDQSLGGMTSNPWPSSDWVAFMSERGIVALVLMAWFFLRLLLSGWRRMREAIDVDERLLAAMLIATAIGACVAGAFDAVLLLALPALLVWTALGALSAPETKPRRFGFVMLLVIFISVAGAARSVAQLVAMDMYGRGVSLQRASEIDPGNYRLHIRLARGRQKCVHARAAHALYPNADEARALARGCR